MEVGPIFPATLARISRTSAQSLSGDFCGIEESYEADSSALLAWRIDSMTNLALRQYFCVQDVDCLLKSVGSQDLKYAGGTESLPCLAFRGDSLF